MKTKKQSESSETSRRYTGFSNLTPSLLESSKDKQIIQVDNIQRDVTYSAHSSSGENDKKRTISKLHLPNEDQLAEPFQNNLSNIYREISRQSTRKSSYLHGKPQLFETEINFKTKFRVHRINRLVRHFVDKLKRVSIHKKPVIYQPFNLKVENNHIFSGIQLHRYVFYVYLFFSIIAIFSNAFLSTFIIAFPETAIRDSVISFNIFNIIWIVFEMFLGFTLEKQKGPKKLKALKQIGLEYVKTQFLIDMMFLIAIAARFDSDYENYFALEFLIFFKITDGVKKLRILEIKIMQFSYQEHFWGLFKMVLTNFSLIHIIAICLILISRLEPDQNWIMSKKIQTTEWWIQYGWAYYWSATTMLTVGFGDIVPANLKEALCLVVIQVFSCMTLAYNINLIGKILDDMQKSHIEKHKNLKVLHQICDQNQVDSELELKLVNHIKQTHKIETKFNLEEQNTFINKLPINLKLNYLRESNTKILTKVQFIKNFTYKTIWKIAEKLNEKMSHPWEIVMDNISKDVVILKQGKVGLFPNIKRNQDIVIDYFQSKGNESTLIEMNFARKNFLIRNYILKSIGYSIIKWINNNDFLQILRERAQDFQYYFSFLDKERRDLDEDFQLIQCKECKKYHSKFVCPRLHYSPIPQKIINSYLYSLKKSKVSRKTLFKRQKVLFNCLILYKSTFENPTFEQFRTSELDLCQDFTLNRKGSRHSKKQDVKCLDWNAPQFKLLKQSIKNELFGAFDFRKSFQQHFWVNQTDKAYDFKFYFPGSNPKQIQKFNNKKLQLRKSSSISRSKSIARKVIV